ncbi:MAG: SynChlorMet cassette protein ScmC [Lentisphaerae bacterium]|nr:SynChlorMet cassette protein ScmC [Lentisphaerota bacterium]
MGLSSGRCLRLKSGAVWRLEGADGIAGQLVGRLCRTMRCERPRSSVAANLLLDVASVSRLSGRRQCRVVAPRVYIPFASAAPCRGRPPSPERLTCHVEAFEGEPELIGRAMSLAYVFSRHAEESGGLLLHGALAELRGRGVILAGVSGMGKTTASRRFKAPWRSLSDDAALVVKAPDGSYWAHPWPTWSRLFKGESNAAWRVSHGVRLAGVFFMSRDSARRVAPVGVSNASIELLGRAYDASWDAIEAPGGAETRRIRLQLLDNARAIASAVPCFSLRVTLRNRFWSAIEQAISRTPSR